jgi:predicted O-linked N-acetylglucosamine transferase (SPINDLY family)
MNEKKFELAKAIECYKFGKINEAKTKFEILIRKYSKDKDILYNYGVFLGEIEEYLLEQKIYKKIIKIDSKDIGALTNLSVSLNSTKNYNEAVFYATKALGINLNIPQAYEARGLARINLAELEDGLKDLKKWVELLLIKNGNTQVKLCLKSCIDLIDIPPIYKSSNEIKLVRDKIEKQIDEVLKKLDRIAEEEINQENIGKKVAFKLNFFYLAYQQENDKKLNIKINRILRKLLNISEKENYPKYAYNKKQKLGIISTFQFHPKVFIFDQINAIDQSKYDIELIIINNSSFRINKLDDYKNEYLKLNAENYEETTKYLNSKNFDVIFFPDIGMTFESRILSLKKLANITVTSWLHPVTTGSPAIDYFLSGELMEKNDAQNSYTEKLIKLPGIGLYIDPSDYISTSIDEIKDRKKSQRFRIGIIQTPFKIHPRMDNIMAEIGKRIPDAEFIFIELQKELDVKLISRIQDSFKKIGIDQRKIKLVKRMEINSYKKFLKDIDISIDTLGWSGGNTTFDAFGAALPVLTVEGDQMRANHTAGMYKLLNLENYISICDEELIERAVNLSKDNHYLTDQKVQLLTNFSKIKTEKDISNFFNQLKFI